MSLSLRKQCKLLDLFFGGGTPAFRCRVFVCAGAFRSLPVGNDTGFVARLDSLEPCKVTLELPHRL